MITYTGRSKIIIRLTDAVNALSTGVDIAPAQIKQAVADAYDAVFKGGDEEDDNDG